MIDFDTRIKNIERELLALKTVSEYSSIRSSNIIESNRVSTGTYQVNFNTGGRPIMAQYFQGTDGYAIISARTPGPSSQLVDVLTTKWDNSAGQYITTDTILIIVSNVPVASVTKIS